MLESFDKNKNPFKVPENYFEGLTKDIMSSLPAQEVKAKRVVLWKKMLPWTGVAALVATIAIAVSLSGSMPNMLAEDNSREETMTEKERIAYNEAEDYILFLEDESAAADYNDVLFDGE